jgi:hypothetical protein
MSCASLLDRLVAAAGGKERRLGGGVVVVAIGRYVQRQHERFLIDFVRTTIDAREPRT